MGRKRRDLSAYEWQHIVNRGSDRQDIFSTDGDRVLWEQLAGESFARFDVELHAFVWMTKQLHQTARYIHRNPLAMIPAPALGAYRWSSLGPLIGARTTPEWLSTGVIGAGPNYLRYVLEPQPGDKTPAGTPSSALCCDDIDLAIAALTGAEVEQIRDGRDRRHGEVRALAVMLAVDLRVATAEELAAHYGLGDPRSIRRLARRGRVRIAESTSFATLRVRTLNQLGRAA